MMEQREKDERDSTADEGDTGEQIKEKNQPHQKKVWLFEKSKDV